MHEVFSSIFWASGCLCTNKQSPRAVPGAARAMGVMRRLLARKGNSRGLWGGGLKSAADEDGIGAAFCRAAAGNRVADPTSWFSVDEDRAGAPRERPVMRRGRTARTTMRGIGVALAHRRNPIDVHIRRCRNARRRREMTGVAGTNIAKACRAGHDLPICLSFL